MPIKSCLILDDEPLFQELLGNYLQQALGDGELELHCAGSIAEARALLPQQAFDLALIDLQLPDGNGSEFLSELGRAQAQCLGVVVTVSDDQASVFSCLQAGARGYLLKNEPGSALVAKLRDIVAGNPPLSGPIASMIMQHFHQRPEPANPLTERETEILVLISKGMSRPEIAELLGLSPHTIADHCKSVYRKLGVSSRAEATRVAIDMGIA